ncbi:MAG: DNA polymerase/3'-5' exonuclease PolX [Saprospiraceae bacterium]|uniref:DNA polymerase/3'-5' exonuclease PolX n=1 Tax=Candidatus Opimibacter skivensis TaxID=2982028 RepID=A0A9D7SY43_9BACT|nr:DNA polymerase/3'-5' exonuclease PolX [Candidatus Opimibacter skivensis]
MVNKQISAQFNLLAALMELHGENSFKIKAYLNAYQSLRKWDRPLIEMSDAEISAIPGIGASTASKIRDIISTGTMEPLEKLKAITPIGIQQLLSIKGLGPKKIRAIWDELGVESPAELLYACTENRLVKLTGFGLKTQEDLQNKISYFLDSQDKHLYGAIESELDQFIQFWQKHFAEYEIEWVGEVARKCPVVSSIECLISPQFYPAKFHGLEQIQLLEQYSDQKFSIRFDDRFAIQCHTTSKEDKYVNWSKLTMSESLFEKLSPAYSTPYLLTGGIAENAKNPYQVLAENGFEGLPPELMDYEGIEKCLPEKWTDLITVKDIRGVLHNHSNWSDGSNTLEEMALHVRGMGYEYFGITDHSKTAFYANGLQPERVLQQLEEIDRLNRNLAPFKIFKGIESDILTDGSLDYDEEILRKFDFIVASIHSNLRMDEEKATARLIGAIENPYTRILGHPTSRLLLARPGYPIDYKKVIDACAANGVVMELNSNPQRMDIDYSWLEYCQEKGVMVSINPDAHSRTQVGYIKYGVFSARKGVLKKENCLNAKGLGEFEKWIERREM